MIANYLKGLKAAIVCVGAMLLTAVGIMAADYGENLSGRLSGLSAVVTQPCAEGEVLWRRGATNLCVDQYEASPASTCVVTDTTSSVVTQDNLNARCPAASQPNAWPWRFVSYTQAKQLCAQSGKRLPTNAEWYELALGQGDTGSCAVKTQNMQAVKTGTSQCVGSNGVHDLVGNVWEWVGDTVTQGVYAGQALPASGYVDLVDKDGVVLRTVLRPGPSFGNDYASTDLSGVRGILRGGYYQSGDDAGIFAQNLAVALDFSAAGVGFRCVRDI